MKKFLLFAGLALSSAAAFAQDYHGFAINASQELIDNVLGTALSTNAYRLEGKAITLQVIYQPQYRIQTVDNAWTTWTEGSTIFKKDGVNSGKLVDWAAGQTNTTDQRLPLVSMEEGTIDGAVLESKMEANGLSYVTLPNKYYKNGVLTDMPATGGDIRVRFCTESGSSSRLGDDAACHAADITGVYVTVDAPSHVKITSDYVQANTTTTFNASGHTGDGDELGGVQRLAYFEMPSTTGVGPQDIKVEGTAKGSWNLFTYKRATSKAPDAYGFPLRYVDIVFYGVKPGDKIGWTNYQSLHAGYTPKAYSGAGVGEILNDDANAPVEYYNLQGMKVANPDKGLYIVRQGNKTNKVIF